MGQGASYGVMLVCVDAIAVAPDEEYQMTAIIIKLLLNVFDKAPYVSVWTLNRGSRTVTWSMFESESVVVCPKNVSETPECVGGPNVEWQFIPDSRSSLTEGMFGDHSSCLRFVQ